MLKSNHGNSLGQAGGYGMMVYMSADELRLVIGAVQFWAGVYCDRHDPRRVQVDQFREVLWQQLLRGD